MAIIERVVDCPLNAEIGTTSDYKSISLVEHVGSIKAGDQLGEIEIVRSLGGLEYQLWLKREGQETLRLKLPLKGALQVAAELLWDEARIQRLGQEARS